jgi:hypothetical protein
MTITVIFALLFAPAPAAASRWTSHPRLLFRGSFHTPVFISPVSIPA